jgi:hypothetical protein
VSSIVSQMAVLMNKKLPSDEEGIIKLGCELSFYLSKPTDRWSEMKVRLHDTWTGADKDVDTLSPLIQQPLETRIRSLGYTVNTGSDWATQSGPNTTQITVRWTNKLTATQPTAARRLLLQVAHHPHKLTSSSSIPHVASPINSISPLPQPATRSSPVSPHSNALSLRRRGSAWCVLCWLALLPWHVVLRSCSCVSSQYFGAGSFTRHTMERSGVSGEDREVVFMVRDQRFVVRRSKLQVQPPYVLCVA